MSQQKATYIFKYNTYGLWSVNWHPLPPRYTRALCSTERGGLAKASVAELRKVYRTEPALWQQAKELGR